MYTFVTRGAETTRLEPDSDLLNDKYLEDNNCESFGREGALPREPFPARCPDISEREISVSNAINFRLDGAEDTKRPTSRTKKAFSNTLRQIRQFDEMINNTDDACKD